MDAFLSALVFQAGYNTTVVSIGSAILGASAGAIGAFVLLRKRSLVSDTISHATLPGLALAFIFMALVTGDGRWVGGLMIGAAISAGIGLVVVEWMVRHTRLAEDAAIGSVLSVFFGFGIVLLTVIQSMETGRQAGISDYLVGSTAGMLRSEDETIAIAALVVGAVIFVMRRSFTLVCFDQEYAAVRGVNVRLTDLVMLGLLLAITVIGLKVAGLVLIVAMTIIPPVTARFWTDRPEPMPVIAAAIGAVSAYLGAIISSLDGGLPTGPLIVLVAFGVFIASMLFSPRSGLFAGNLRKLSFRHDVHERQGMLALARGKRIRDPVTLRILQRKGLVRRDGVATPQGQAAGAEVVRDEARWALYCRLYPEEAAGTTHQGVTAIKEALPPDLIADLDRRLSLQQAQP